MTYTSVPEIAEVPTFNICERCGKPRPVRRCTAIVREQDEEKRRVVTWCMRCVEEVTLRRI